MNKTTRILKAFCAFGSVFFKEQILKVEMKFYVRKVFMKIARILSSRAELKPSVSSSKVCTLLSSGLAQCKRTLVSGVDGKSRRSSYENEECFINREKKEKGKKYNAD